MEVRITLRPMSSDGVRKWITIASNIRKAQGVHAVEVLAIMRVRHPGHTVTPLIQGRVE